MARIDGVGKSTKTMNFIRRFSSEVRLYEDVEYLLIIRYGGFLVEQQYEVPLATPRSLGRVAARKLGRKQLMKWCREWRASNPIGAKITVRGSLVMTATKFIQLDDNSAWSGGQGIEYWAYGPYNIRGHKREDNNEPKH
ncbi:MAG: hypothetical protein PHI12_07845 [Dehalococcoidales bacterium]|jgi:hypothetical protein|nr:hypothetical protein [Dehalococcoidales bacterium]